MSNKPELLKRYEHLVTEHDLEEKETISLETTEKGDTVISAKLTVTVTATPKIGWPDPE